MPRSPAPGGFGRKIDPQAQEMARRREAFLAAERARNPASHQSAPPPQLGSPGGRSAGGHKSLALAYILWFGCGAVSAHRFYLGFTTLAIVQVSLWFVGWMMVAAGIYVALIFPLAAAFWLVVDAFLMPGLCRRANERRRQFQVAGAFA